MSWVEEAVAEGIMRVCRCGHPSIDHTRSAGCMACVCADFELPPQRCDCCPECAARRAELVAAPGRFYCPQCGVAGAGPAPPRPGAQLELL